MIWPSPTDVGDVYEPAEDSALLAQAAREAVGPGDLVLDVGTGTGYVAGAAAATGARVVATDLNPHACRRARRLYGPGDPDGGGRDEPADGDRELPTPVPEGAADAGPVEVVRADLLGGLCGPFDAVAFNPPYLPGGDGGENAGGDRGDGAGAKAGDGEDDDWMRTALSGGPSGRAVIDRFLADLGRVLAPGGVGLVLVSTLTGVEEVVELADEAGFSAAAVAEESFPFETLTVLKLVR